jgi:transposase InsO family protein
MIHPLLLKLRPIFLELKLPFSMLYKAAGVSRQAHHKGLVSMTIEDEKWRVLPNLVKGYRSKYDSRAGSRSLYFNLNIKEVFGVGINQFEQKMAELCLTLRPLRTRVVTTQSSIQSWNYSNLTQGLEVVGINQVVVGDLTYVIVDVHRYYLFCLTDVYSARIVGWSLAIDMKADKAIEALRMFMSVRGKPSLKNCIHHTDGGGQYFSRVYLNLLNDLGMQISRADNCLENGHAEQKNGYIKHHLLPNVRGKTLVSVQRQVAKLIDFYNNDRKQEGLGWLSPKAFEEGLNGRNLKLHNFEKNGNRF